MGRYGIKEIFDTLQGEGARVGTRSVFVRFSGCNLWNGNPLHRDEGDGACARWCDTDFFKGKVMSTEEILAAMDEAWPREQAVRRLGFDSCAQRWCTLTGGEPALQLTADLVDALHNAGWLIAVETNGTIPNGALSKCDWVCVSPKLGTSLKFVSGHELKVILPGDEPGKPGWTDAELEALEALRMWQYLFVQPQDPLLSDKAVELTLLRRNGTDVPEETEQIAGSLFGMSVGRCLQFIQGHSAWRLSQQGHKHIDIR